jgi:hypothetical protein
MARDSILYKLLWFWCAIAVVCILLFGIGYAGLIVNAFRKPGTRLNSKPSFKKKPKPVLFASDMKRFLKKKSKQT